MDNFTKEDIELALSFATVHYIFGTVALFINLFGIYLIIYKSGKEMRLLIKITMTTQIWMTASGMWSAFCLRTVPATGGGFHFLGPFSFLFVRFPRPFLYCIYAMNYFLMCAVPLTISLEADYSFIRDTFGLIITDDQMSLVLKIYNLLAFMMGAGEIGLVFLMMLVSLQHLRKSRMASSLKMHRDAIIVLIGQAFALFVSLSTPMAEHTITRGAWRETTRSVLLHFLHTLLDCPSISCTISMILLTSQYRQFLLSITKRTNNPSVTAFSVSGLNVESFSFRGTKYQLWDVPSFDGANPPWGHYYESAKALIFVIDAANKEEYPLAAELLAKLVQNDTFKGPLLVFASKSDIESSVDVLEIIRILNLSQLNRKWHVQPCSAKTGEDCLKGMEWIHRSLL